MPRRNAGASGWTPAAPSPTASPPIRTDAPAASRFSPAVASGAPSRSSIHRLRLRSSYHNRSPLASRLANASACLAKPASRSKSPRTTRQPNSAWPSRCPTTRRLAKRSRLPSTSSPRFSRPESPPARSPASRSRRCSCTWPPPAAPTRCLKKKAPTSRCSSRRASRIYYSSAIKNALICSRLTSKNRRRSRRTSLASMNGLTRLAKCFARSLSRKLSRLKMKTNPPPSSASTVIAIPTTNNAWPHTSATPAGGTCPCRASWRR